MYAINHPKWTLPYLPLLAHLHLWIDRYYSFSSILTFRFHYSQIIWYSSHSSKIILSSLTLSQSSFTYLPSFSSKYFHKKLIFCHPLNNYRTIKFHPFNLDSLWLFFSPFLFYQLFSFTIIFFIHHSSGTPSTSLLFSLSLILVIFISLSLISIFLISIIIRFYFWFDLLKFFFEFSLPIFCVFITKFFWDDPLLIWFFFATLIISSFVLILFFFILIFLIDHTGWEYL